MYFNLNRGVRDEIPTSSRIRTDSYGPEVTNSRSDSRGNKPISPRGRIDSYGVGETTTSPRATPYSRGTRDEKPSNTRGGIESYGNETSNNNTRSDSRGKIPMDDDYRDNARVRGDNIVRPNSRGRNTEDDYRPVSGRSAAINRYFFFQLIDFIILLLHVVTIIIIMIILCYYYIFNIYLFLMIFCCAFLRLFLSSYL